MSELCVSHLHKEFPTPEHPLVVLDDVSLELASGDSLAIVGPSGSGKSTFLQIVGTLDQPTSGQVRFDGTDPFQLAPEDLARFRNQNVGFVFQDHHLLPQLTVWQNVLVPAVATGRPYNQDQQRANELLERVGLSDRLHHRPSELSGGQRQRVAIARGLLRNPPLILADEPTGNLDHATSDAAVDLLLELHRDTNSILITVTHNAAVAERMARKAELSNGALQLI